MHVIVVVAVMLVVLLLGRSMEQRMFQDDPQRKEQFRRRLYAWSWRAAGVALVLAMLFVLWLRNLAPH